MEFVRKSFLVGCTFAIAGCAQGGLSGSQSSLGAAGLSALPSLARGEAPSKRRGTGSDGPQIYVFQGTPDATNPMTGLVAVGNTMYGTTYNGGTNNLGAVYSVTPGGAETVMHSFAGGADGQNPDAALTNVNGTLYGTTYQAGAEHGTIFSITPGGEYHVVYNFGVKAGDCVEPDAAMIYAPGKNALYGTAYGGGATGEGCIFKLSFAGKKPKESVVYSFTGASDSSTQASAPVMYKSALYLTTPGGGTAGRGAVLKVTLTGKETLLYSFKDDPDGASPEASLTLIDNAFYGTTAAGGQGACGGYAGCGTIFKVTPGGKEKVLYRFTDVVSKTDGIGPQAAMIAVGSTLIGTTPQCSGNGCGAGTIFETNTNGKENVLYSFGLTSSSPAGTPENPYAPVIDLNGTLYGTTDESAKIGEGTVYALKL